jgi:hypothetical protein
MRNLCLKNCSREGASFEIEQSESSRWNACGKSECFFWSSKIAPSWASLESSVVFQKKKKKKEKKIRELGTNYTCFNTMIMSCSGKIMSETGKLEILLSSSDQLD